MKNFIHKNLHSIVFISILFLIFFGLFFSDGVVMHGDVSENFNKVSRLNFMEYLFSDYGSLNNVENFNRTTFYYPLILLVKYLNFDITRIFELIYLVLFGLGMFGMHNLLSYLLQNQHKTLGLRILIISLSLFFVFSPWAITRNQAYFFVLSMYLLPWLMLHVYKYLTLFNIRHLFIIAIILTYIATTPQYIFFVGLFLITFFLLYILKNKINYHRAIKGFILLASLFLGLNLHWILPLVMIWLNSMNVGVGYDMSADMINFFSSNIDFLNIITGFDSWVDSDSCIFINLIKRIGFLLLYLIGILYFIFGRSSFFHNKHIHSISFFCMIIFLGIQIYYIDIYYWLESIGLGTSIGFMLRDMSKLSFLFWFLISIILGFIFSGSKNKTIIAIAILMITFGTSFSRIYSDFYIHFKKNKIPQEYIDLNNYLGNQDKAYKVIFLAPFHYGMGKNYNNFETSYIWAPQKTASRFIEVSTPMPSIGYYHITFRNREKTIYKKIYPEFTSLDPNKNIPQDIGEKILSKANVKYLVYHNDIVGALEKGNEAVQILKEKTDLRLIKVFGDYIYLFENPHLKPIAYVGNNSELNIRKINPTKYKIKGNVKGSYLYFAQTYDPFWILKINGKYIQPQKAFDFDLIKFDISGVRNLDGEIVYFPQKYYDIGLKISISIFLLLCRLIWIGKNKAIQIK